MKAKRWLFVTVALVAGLLTAVAMLVIAVDPYFHYRAPRTDLFFYLLDNQRCQNDGIVRHFDYQALVTGTSMCENFKASEVERLWGLKTVKVAFSGASYRELARIIDTAARSNPRLELVIVGIDFNKLLYPSDWMRNDLGVFPDYLYDDRLLNDVKYWFNRDATVKSLRAVCHFGVAGMTSFDDYSAWHDANTGYGEAAVLKGTSVAALPQQPVQAFTEADRKTVGDNFRKNFLPIILAVPQVNFFLTPYSEARMEIWRKSGRYSRMKAAAEELKRLIDGYSNARLFDFSEHTEITGNLNNYRDLDHYGPWVNTWILEQMRKRDTQEALRRP